MEIGNAPKAGRDSPISAYQAKKDGLWEEWTDRIEGCLTEYDIQLVGEEIIQAYHNNELPAGWAEELEKARERRANAIKQETENGSFDGQHWR